MSDLISKRFIQDALIERISNLNAEGEKSIQTARELIRFKKFVDGITPIRAEIVHGWISVSERLPKECDGHVLVSKEDGQVTTGLHSEFSNVWYIGDMCGVGGCKVIAWMPLPEPYREDGEACTE